MDDNWEFSWSDSHEVSYGRVAEDDFEVASDFIKVEIDDWFKVVGYSEYFGFSSDIGDHAVKVFFGEQIEDPYRIQHIVDWDQELFFFDLGIGHQEYSGWGWWLRNFFINFLKIIFQNIDLERGSDYHLIDIVSYYEGS